MEIVWSFSNVVGSTLQCCVSGYKGLVFTHRKWNYYMKAFVFSKLLWSQCHTHHQLHTKYLKSSLLPIMRLWANWSRNNTALTKTVMKDPASQDQKLKRYKATQQRRVAWSVTPVLISMSHLQGSLCQVISIIVGSPENEAITATVLGFPTFPTALRHVYIVHHNKLVMLSLWIFPAFCDIALAPIYTKWSLSPAAILVYISVRGLKVLIQSLFYHNYLSHQQNVCSGTDPVP